MGKKFINIFNKSANKTANQLSDNDAFEVVHEITKNKSLAPAQKWRIIYDFTQSSMTVDEVRECLLNN